MLDSTSIGIISRFKEAVLSRSLQIPEHLNTPRLRSNRGNKLEVEQEGLRSRVVEYDGKDHLVFADSDLQKITLRNKRKWKEFYDPDKNGIKRSAIEAIAQLLESDDEEDEDSEDIDNDTFPDTKTNGNSLSTNGNGGVSLNGTSNSNTNENPLATIKLSEILAPIEHPSEIISHPAISRTFKLTVFHRLSMDLIELIEVEQDTLNWLNKLLQVLNGEDWYYLLEENLGLKAYDHGLDDDRKKRIYDETTAAAADNNSVTTSTATAITTSANANGDDSSLSSGKNIMKYELGVTTTLSLNDEMIDVTDPFFALPETLKRYEAHQADVLPGSNNELFALQEDLINYLQVSIQRQHEYVKNLIELRKGLVRADRLRHDLYKWGKEMYDKKST
ncbi:histone deacetylase complex subunit Rxt2 [Scheffersomyces spartinae]|uniref:Histone deacetylase complex subunit Rxt2 n=1 Tax=Scheffersomyces spartinae TaxID=45513 RepID=A0A9P7V8H1_9ASCO|nr:histone deacetylase complex subunit Rxt2 [Scheffersomyces spartinae]KAG7193312.1 histone deacetylase complex subunit Rxt2 [Scheffersomyces spartinae]